MKVDIYHLKQHCTVCKRDWWNSGAKGWISSFMLEKTLFFQPIHLHAGRFPVWHQSSTTCAYSVTFLATNSPTSKIQNCYLIPRLVDSVKPMPRILDQIHGRPCRMHTKSEQGPIQPNQKEEMMRVAIREGGLSFHHLLFIDGINIINRCIDNHKVCTTKTTFTAWLTPFPGNNWGWKMEALIFIRKDLATSLSLVFLCVNKAVFRAFYHTLPSQPEEHNGTFWTPLTLTLRGKL